MGKPNNINSIKKRVLFNVFFLRCFGLYLVCGLVLQLLEKNILNAGSAGIFSTYRDGVTIRIKQCNVDDDDGPWSWFSHSSIAIIPYNYRESIFSGMIRNLNDFFFEDCDVTRISISAATFFYALKFSWALIGVYMVHLQLEIVTFENIRRESQKFYVNSIVSWKEYGVDK
ncbi:hypothetical protein SNEBB_010368 [Seison nebaliae]|nr:hypothetical protein SNEBB_010368 [Seison nebaliae]